LYTCALNPYWSEAVITPVLQYFPNNIFRSETVNEYDRTPTRIVTVDNNKIVRVICVKIVFSDTVCLNVVTVSKKVVDPCGFKGSRPLSILLRLRAISDKNSCLRLCLNYRLLQKSSLRILYYFDIWYSRIVYNYAILNF